MSSRIYFYHELSTSVVLLALHDLALIAAKTKDLFTLPSLVFAPATFKIIKTLTAILYTDDYTINYLCHVFSKPHYFLSM